MPSFFSTHWMANLCLFIPSFFLGVNSLSFLSGRFPHLTCHMSHCTCSMVLMFHDRLMRFFWKKSSFLLVLSKVRRAKRQQKNTCFKINWENNVGFFWKKSSFLLVLSKVRRAKKQQKNTCFRSIERINDRLMRFFLEKNQFFACFVKGEKS